MGIFKYSWSVPGDNAAPLITGLSLFSPKSEVKVGADGVEKSLEGPRTSVITKPEKKLGAYWETGKFVSGYKKNSVGILFTFHSEARRRHSSYEQRSGGTWGTWCLTGT